ncbi:MAG TPA: FkbM family methyltransferase [Candidatus Saccharimonadales bacterium]|nr:FkbM family methyltransferase [Candidatus Saccharimonadales bacterium]
MIDNEAFPTYAQYSEDVILLALLHGVKQGFYVDVGANFPIDDSVTKLFYERGWRGINIEPIKSVYTLLEKDRPKDINLNLGVGSKVATLDFREYMTVPGHSTFANLQKNSERELEFTEYKVRVQTLRSILSEQKVKEIDFLKVDVEGFEYEVIVGNDWQRFRPKVICIEANHIYKDWRVILADNNYKLFISDGLNEYYIAYEAKDITNGFAERAVLYRDRAIKYRHLKAWKKDVRSLAKSQAQVKQLARENEELKRQNIEADKKNAELQQLTLQNRPLRSRVKRAVYGLTVDWIKFKRQSN